MADVQMNPVQSSNISAVGYDADAKELHVRFGPGSATHIYSDVPAGVHEALLGAQSIGAYFHAKIRNVYTSRKKD